MVERSHQISSHEGHSEASFSFTSKSPVIPMAAISTWGGYLSLGMSLAMSRAGDKPGLITSQPDKCSSQLSHGLHDSVLFFLLRHCRAFMYKHCNTLERWWYFQLLRLPPLVLLNYECTYKLNNIYFPKGQSQFAHGGAVSEAPALCKQTISTPLLPNNKLWATDSVNTNTKLTV